MRIIFRLFLIALSLFIGGCKVGPDYEPPENHVPDRWLEPIADVHLDADLLVLDLNITPDPPLTEWWKVFNDPYLNKYVETAANYNNTVKTAESNVQQARAYTWVTASSLFPQIFADTNASRTYFSRNGPVFALQSPSAGGGTISGKPAPTNPGTGSGSPIAPGFQVVSQIPRIQNLYNATFDATWELDIFGKTRRGLEAAEANLDSSMESRNDTLLSILAEVARNYVELRSYQKKELLIEQNISLIEEESHVIRNRFQSGLVNRLDLDRIEGELASALADLPNIKAEIYKRIFTLSILTGDLPEALFEELYPLYPLPSMPNDLALGIRSDLLRRRPDVRQAERQLAVATANIGVAVASFFPSVSLNGFEGFQSLRLGNLFSPRSFTWSMGGDINLPVFQGGKLVGNLRVNEAIAVGAVYTYQQTVLTALEEAESSLVTYIEEREKGNRLNKSVEINQRVSDLTNQRYAGGLVSLTDLLDSNRQLISSQLNLLESQTAALVDIIALYKALGGGWEAFPICLPPMIP